MPAISRDSLLLSMTVVLSSFLLFLLEPMIGKQILPWFGGAAAVWAACLVFYQSALLAGYVYASKLAQLRSLHPVLLAVSLTLLPIGPNIGSGVAYTSHPALRILGLLALSVGLPFALLSATSPWAQSTLSIRGSQTPYWLFAVSNAASFSGLFAYPIFVERLLTLQQQRQLWSAVYVVFVCLSIASCIRGPSVRRKEQPIENGADLKDLIIWFLLAAGGAMLLLGVTNHLTENVAPVPLLWVLPLAIYLASFILAFSKAAANRTWWTGTAIFGLVLVANAIYDIDAVEPIQITIPVMLFGLFGGTMLCHSELYLRRPEPALLNCFYIAIAAGGAAGSIFVALVAPVLFTGISELPFAMFFVAALAALLFLREGRMLRLLWLGVAVGMLAVFVANVRSFEQGSLAAIRSFYGALRVVQSGYGFEQRRTLFHGRIEHGAQFLLLPNRTRPTTYYGTDSGVGIALRELMPSPKKVGVVGLGVGTLAAYGTPGDLFHFYEINPQVTQLAQATFFYLRESKARIEIETGDARLMLARDQSHRYDLLAVDAFSGDAIPVHLLTREALSIYKAHLLPRGIIAFHVSNNYLDLASVVHSLAKDAGLYAALYRNHDDPDSMILASDWVLVTADPEVLNNASLRLHQRSFDQVHLPVWTDERNNLLAVFKPVSIKTQER